MNSEGQENASPTTAENTTYSSSYLDIWHDVGDKSKFLLPNFVSQQSPREENRCSVFSAFTVHTHRSVMTRDSFKHVELNVANLKLHFFLANSLMSSVCIHSLHRSVMTRDLGTEASVSASSVEASIVQ